MIDGVKVVAFTPSGRKRYMDILRKIVEREHALGNIDEWVIFNNAYIPADDQYTRAMGNGWIKVHDDGLHLSKRKPETIHRFYDLLRDMSAIFVRLDDDIVFAAEGSIKTLVQHKLRHPDQFLSFPVILNNTRMSYFLQQNGCIPYDWGTVSENFLDKLAWRDGRFAEHIHRKALDDIYEGQLYDEFFLSNMVLKGRSADNMCFNHVSVNCFAISGEDMYHCQVPRDEEGYLSDIRPLQLGRFNGICGDAIVAHFAYHPQTAHMEATGLLEEYYALAHNQSRPVRKPGGSNRA